MMQHKRFYLLIALSMVALFTAVVGLSSLSRTALADVAAPAEPSALIPPLPPAAWSSLAAPSVAGAHRGSAFVVADLTGNGYRDLVIGEPDYTSGLASMVGRVLIFPYDSDANSFASTPTVTIIGTQAGARLGASLAAGDFNGDELYDLAIGSPGRSAVFVYSGTTLNSPNPTPSWSYIHNQPNAQFGHSLQAIAPLTDNFDYSYELAVGAPQLTNSGEETGAVYLFLTDGTTGLGGSPPVVRYGLPDSRFGHALTAADLDGDNYDDLIIGAPGTTVDYVNEGAVFVYYLDPGPLAIAATPDESYYGMQEEAWLGYAVATGDIDGDWYDDLLLGAPGYKNIDEQMMGAVFGYVSTPQMLDSPQAKQPLAADWMVYGSYPNSWFGGAITAVDYNQDGRMDVAIGAKKQPYNVNTPEAGAVFIFFQGEDNMLQTDYNWKLVGLNPNSHFGATLIAADFDFSNSSYADEIIVGAPQASIGSAPQVGAVYHFPGFAPMPLSGLMLNGPDVAPVGQNVPFSATVTSGQNILYEWHFGDDLPAVTTYSIDEMPPSAVQHRFFEPGQYEVQVRALQPQSTAVESMTKTIEVFPSSVNLALKTDRLTRLGNATNFRVGVQTESAVDLTLHFGNGEVRTFELQPGNNDVRLAHQYADPGFYKITAVVQNDLGLEWRTITRVRVVRTVSARDGGQIQHEWGNDPDRLFLVDVNEGAVTQNYELHFNPVGDATFTNPFPENNGDNLLIGDIWDDDDLTPLNISVFFDLEVHDPLGDHCTFLPLVQGGGSGSGGSGSTAASPCLTGGSTAVDTFNEPLLLTFTYKDEDIPAGTDEEDIRFVYFDTELNQWIDGATTCPGGSDASYIRDPANNTIKLPICHQSRWAIVGG